MSSHTALQQITTSLAANTVVSSTDVAADDNGGFQFVWSRRAHPLIANTTAGTINFVAGGTGTAWQAGESYVTDPAVSIWSALGVTVGSKFMYLGQPTGVVAGTGAVFDPFAFAFLATLSNSPKGSAYGLDGTVADVTSTPTNMYIKDNVFGGQFLPNTPWLLVASALGTTTSGFGTLTDASVNFVTSNVQPGDIIYFSDATGTNQEGWFPVATVAAHTLTAAGGFTFANSHPGTSANITYGVYIGRPFTYAVVPPSFIDSVRFSPVVSVPAHSGEMSVQNLIGSAPQIGLYVIAETEPDLVRISRGGDNWLLVYQSFRTTSMMSASLAGNFDDNHNQGFLDQATALPLQDSGGCYREHISTNAVLLSDQGTMVSPSVSDPTITTVFPTSVQAIERESRDIELSNRSLGTRPPITFRPNYMPSVITPASSTGFRHTYNYAIQVAAQTFCHRWGNTSAPPALIPDVTWTGSDWVAVSPTKKTIHAYTGTYIVTGTAAGDVYIADPTFYFGLDSSNPIDGNFQRATIQTGDKIWFGPPAGVGVYGTVAAIHSEHIIQLVEADSAILSKGSTTLTGTFNVPGGTGVTASVSQTGLLFPGNVVAFSSQPGIYYKIATVAGTAITLSTAYTGAPNGAATAVVNGYYSNIEWALIRSSTSAQLGGIKNPGYRIGSDGRVILSSSYVTFANDPTDDQWQSLPEQSSLMRRNNIDYWAYLASQSETTPFVFKHDGHNLPGNQLNDVIDPESRYLADIAFKGVAVGEPKGCNELAIGEPPCAAIAWGETMYASLDHIVSGNVSARSNYVAAYRQSFGPWNNGIRNLRIVGKYTSPFHSSGAGDVPLWNELKVLTQARVLTRHWTPTSGTGFFATDGYRNVFGSNLLTASSATGSTFAPTLPGGPAIGGSRLSFTYTNAVGRGAITLHGPRPTAGVVTPASGFRNDASAVTAWRSVLNPSAPRVLWDGTRFVASWVDGGNGVYAALAAGSPLVPAFLNIAVLPGDEDRGIQGSELVGADNALNQPQSPQIFDTLGLKVAQSAMIQAASAGYNQFVVHDIAFSGKVYAVIWCAGLDTATGNHTASLVGVTLFDAAGVSGDGQVLNAMPLTTGSVGAASGTTTFTDATQNFGVTLGAAVQAGDVLIINNGIPANAVGRYTVVSAGTTTLTTTLPVPSIGSAFYSVHRPILPSGAMTYVIGAGPATFADGSLGHPAGQAQEDAFGTPKIVWDGKQFVAVFRSGVVNPAVGGGTTTSQTIASVAVPESGLSHPMTIKKAVGPGVSIGGAGTSAGIGTVSSHNSQYVHVTNTQSPSLALSSRGVWPDIAVGDILIVTSSSNASPYKDNGWYPILDVDYSGFNVGGDVIGVIGVDHAFTPGDTVYGAIISGNIGDSLNAVTSAFGSTVLKPGYALDVSPNPRLVNESSWGTGVTVPATMQPARICGFVYNDVDDEYAMLVLDTGGNLALTTWKRGRVKASPELLIVSGAGPLLVTTAALAWNGRQYFVAYNDDAGESPIYYVTVSPTLVIEDSGPITTGAEFLFGSLAKPVIGTTVYAVPGPLYAGYQISRTNLALVRNIQILWNSRLNRWVVSGSFLWHVNENQVSSYNSNELVNQFPLSSTTVTAVSGNQLTLSGNTDVTNIQAGCKLLVTNAHGGTTNLVAIVGVTNVLSPAGAHPIVVIDTPYLPTVDATGNDFPTPGVFTSLPTGSYWILPREDIFCWTLGYDRPAVQFDDADDSFLDDVSIGGVLDIEEKYTHMARPVWQAGSPAVGEPDFHNGHSPSGYQRQAQYNHLLMTPAPKVRLPRFTNVRSSTKVKHGYGVLPGSPYTDRTEAYRRR
jgi:hypothetical protein